MLKRIHCILFAAVMLIMVMSSVSFSFVSAETSDYRDKELLQIQYYSDDDGMVYFAYPSGEHEYCLYLPSGIKEEEKKLAFSETIVEGNNGSVTDTNRVETAGGEKMLSIKGEDGAEYSLLIRKSKLPCISILLHNTSLETIYSNSKKEKYKDNCVILSSEEYGLKTIEGTELKGRGNFTWGLDKRSFQIKFPDALPVFGMNEAKTWILLPNYLDNSLIRNKLALDLAREMNLDYALDSRYIDLWIEGEYLGNYLLTEKVQINANRVDLQDEMGVLIELDNIYYGEEQYHRASSVSGTEFVLKDAVALNSDENTAMEAFDRFMKYMNEFEETLYSHEDWGKVLSFIDIDSFIRLYFLQELSEDSDGLRSSFFMYWDGETDRIHLGPAWDYDVAFGNFTTDKRGGNPRVDYVEHIAQTMEVSSDLFGQLCKYDEFRRSLNSYYQRDLRELFANLNDRIKQYAEQLSLSAEMNFKRWDTQGKAALFDDGHENKATYTEEVEYLSKWVKDRVEYLNEKYQ